jgi:putative Mn2+ efflux pump MntP
MSFWTLVLVALGVSADAFAVALGKGLHMKTFNLRHAVVIAVAFGLAQAVMPVLGWALGTRFADSIVSVDHWVAFGLLAIIGAKSSASSPSRRASTPSRSASASPSSTCRSSVRRRSSA